MLIFSINNNLGNYFKQLKQGSFTVYHEGGTGFDMTVLVFLLKEFLIRYLL